MDALLVADSFRVRVHRGRAEVRSLRSHLARFSRDVHAAGGPGARELDRFIREARRRIAASGEGFPRLELWSAPGRGSTDAGSDAGLGLAIRPLPRLGETVELRSARGIALDHPERKGPNIERLAGLNRELGAEALLLDGAGRAVEGATTSLLWWRDGALWASASEARVASVTEHSVIEIATGAGIPVARGEAEPAELVSGEVWAVNALHGIRRVARIDDVPTPEADEARLSRFRHALDAGWESLAD